jgi:hypothetical protein
MALRDPFLPTGEQVGCGSGLIKALSESDNACTHKRSLTSTEMNWLSGLY